MGIRAWFTPVKSYNEFNKAIESIEINPYSIGINFILQLNQDIDAFPTKTILIAWTGDGSASLKELKPMQLQNETWLLDNLDETFRTDPFTLGNIYESVNEITDEMFTPYENEYTNTSMEVKLTTDWIIMHNSEIFINADGKGCFRIFDNDFQYHLIELALKTMNVNYECEELYQEDDEDYEKPSYYYTFENIEDIKESCPELYAEFQRMINVEIKEAEERKKKQDFILKILDVPKTRTQIINHVEKEFYPERNPFATSKNFIKAHVGYLIDSLYENDLIRYDKNKIERL